MNAGFLAGFPPQTGGLWCGNRTRLQVVAALSCYHVEPLSYQVD